jgi:hypothetical protein
MKNEVMYLGYHINRNFVSQRIEIQTATMDLVCACYSGGDKECIQHFLEETSWEYYTSKQEWMGGSH